MILTSNPPYTEILQGTILEGKGGKCSSSETLLILRANDSEMANLPLVLMLRSQVQV